MNVIEKTLNLYAGQTVIFDPDLILTVPLKVKRDGLGYDIKAGGTPTAREVTHNNAAGSLTFLIPGTVGITDLVFEKVDVLIKQP